MRTSVLGRECSHNPTLPLLAYTDLKDQWVPDWYGPAVYADGKDGNQLVARKTVIVA
ncbi:hypothetical protein Arad_3636 [Rhizobium rhizogenes K84]|uniref:Uncharacterized protein n=1 Tax=Rhizobium rhizogenes (strain K84 / ATCC BAA-868) TaxID=311403 RepID=B9J9D8_RHIR8|nr:hypothetical protein Arad_3636 [Rhizobium rhizogenes K84]